MFKTYHILPGILKYKWLQMVDYSEPLASVVVLGGFSIFKEFLNNGFSTQKKFAVLFAEL